MSYIDITEKDKQAIEKSEIDEFERKRLRGTGYELMKTRDMAYGLLPSINGGELHVEWSVDNALREDGKLYRNVPSGCIVLRINKEEVIVDADAFRKLLRWA